MKNKIIVALDFQTFSECKNLIDLLADSISIYKVGLEAYLNYGNEIISYLKNKNKQIFLDLKFNDIPNTTLKALEYALRQDVLITTVHATVGDVAIKQIVDLNKNYPNTIVAFVTVLTSFEQVNFNKTFNNNISIKEAIIKRVKDMNDLSISAVVCSPHEASEIKKINNKIITVCPGVRLNSKNNDQSRIMTPSQAFNDGADYIVIGREITKSIDPLKSLKLIMEDINENCN